MTDNSVSIQSVKYDLALNYLENIVRERTSGQHEFNVKFYDYGGEIQLRIYKNPVKYGQSKTKEQSKLESVRSSYTREELTEKIEAGEIGLHSSEMNDYLDRLNRSLTISINRSKNKVYEYARANKWE